MTGSGRTGRKATYRQQAAHTGAQRATASIRPEPLSLSSACGHGSPGWGETPLAHLAGIARVPNVTIQVVPSIAHAGLLGGFALTERAAYVETAVAGQVFQDTVIIANLLTRFDTLRNEAFRGSESLTLIERMCEEWKATGARAVTQAPTAGNA
jgi:Domain of unknown function (DUF5753)